MNRNLSLDLPVNSTYSLPTFQREESQESEKAFMDDLGDLATTVHLGVKGMWSCIASAASTVKTVFQDLIEEKEEHPRLLPSGHRQVDLALQAYLESKKDKTPLLQDTSIKIALFFQAVDLEQIANPEYRATVLDLSHLNVSFLPAQVFDRDLLFHLVEINLSHNRLTEFPFEATALPQLEKLDLSHNQLVKVPSNIHVLRKLKEFNLSNNPSLEFVTMFIFQLPESCHIDLSFTSYKLKHLS